MKEDPSSSSSTDNENHPEPQHMSNAERFWNILLLPILLCSLFFNLTIDLIHSILKAFWGILPTRKKSVRGEIVLITSTSALNPNRELALKYASKGATVVLWNTDNRISTSIIDEIVDCGYTQAYAYTCDITNHDSVQNTAKIVQQEVGDVTILINVANEFGLKQSAAQFWDIDVERTLRVNTLSQFWTIEAFLGRMKENNHGHIVVVSSFSGMFGVANYSPYCASQFALLGLMESVQDELKADPNCRVKCTTICLYPYVIMKPKNWLQIFMPNATNAYIAKQIVRAQRTDTSFATLPGFLLPLACLTRFLPPDGQTRIKNALFVEQ